MILTREPCLKMDLVKQSSYLNCFSVEGRVLKFFVNSGSHFLVYLGIVQISVLKYFLNKEVTRCEHLMMSFSVGINAERTSLNDCMIRPRDKSGKCWEISGSIMLIKSSTTDCV